MYWKSARYSSSPITATTDFSVEAKHRIQNHGTSDGTSSARVVPFIVLYVGGFWVIALVFGIVAHWWAKTDTSVPARLLREAREEGLRQKKAHDEMFGASFGQLVIEWQRDRDAGLTTLDFDEWACERYPQRKLLKR